MNEHKVVSENIDIDGVRRLLPQRPPFLMVDRLTEVCGRESAVGWKAVSSQ